MKSQLLPGIGLLLVAIALPACSHVETANNPASNPTVTTLETPQPISGTTLETAPLGQQAGDSTNLNSSSASNPAGTTNPANSTDTASGGTSLSAQPMQQTATTVTVAQAMAALGAKQTAGGIRVVLPENVLFDFDKYSIRPDAQDALTKLSVLLKNYANAPVDINGYTDSIGSVTYNQTLSENRANAVKNYLVQNFGIGGDRLSTDGLGKTNFVAPNTNPDGSDNPTGRQQNRRVEVIIHNQQS